MARITVDDCLKRITNRFQLTLAATYRARQIAMGSTPQVEVDKDTIPAGCTLAKHPTHKAEFVRGYPVQADVVTCQLP